jgi:hypothetical protein
LTELRERQEEVAYQQSLRPHVIIYPWTPLHIGDDQELQHVEAPWVRERKEREREARDLLERAMVTVKQVEADTTPLQILSQKAQHLLKSVGLLTPIPNPAKSTSVPSSNSTPCINKLAIKIHGESHILPRFPGERAPPVLVEALFPTHSRIADEDTYTFAAVQFESYPPHRGGWASENGRRAKDRDRTERKIERHLKKANLSRPRLVEDDRFWRVLAMENLAAMHTHIYPSGPTGCTKATLMGLGFLRHRQPVGSSPLRKASSPRY